MAKPLGPVDYRGGAPAIYCCARCGASGCKMWRDYQTFFENIDMLCVDCAGKKHDVDVSQAREDGKVQTEYGLSDAIAWHIPAVPTEEGDTFWGYTSVPEMGVRWWQRLPLRAGKAVRHG